MIAPVSTLLMLSVLGVSSFDHSTYRVYEDYNYLIPTSGYIRDHVTSRSMADCAAQCLLSNCSAFFHGANTSRCQIHAELPVDRKAMDSNLDTTCYIADRVRVCSRDAWSYNNAEKCYIFDGSLVRSFVESRVYCAENNGSLVKIDNKDQNTFLHNLLQNYSANNTHYLGLNDIAVDGDFRWSDAASTQPSYTDWGASQPSNSTLENCVVYNPLDEGKWYATTCAGKHNTVCEI